MGTQNKAGCLNYSSESPETETDYPDIQGKDEIKFCG